MTAKMDKRIAEAIGVGLNKWRIGAGLIQREVARRCKLTERRVSAIELAKADLKPSELEAVAGIEDIEVDWCATLPNLAAAIIRQTQNGEESQQ